jgi:hypothetical protein
VADERDDDDKVIDFRDLTRSALERMLAKAMRRKKGEKDESDSKDADKEREDLANLSEEKKGKSNAPKVKEDDFHPDDVKNAKKEDADESDKAPPFKKKKKG